MTIKSAMLKLAQDAKEASLRLARLNSNIKNSALIRMADELIKQADVLKEANKKDLQDAKDKGLSPAMIDRLTLSDKVIKGMADGLKEVAALTDPVGEILRMWRRPNGLLVGKMRIPLGVIGIIYESRPNVTAD
ncbi:MAG: gamma-glutamyl-phosphate reductase, partial [Nitrospirae bacterium]|nr:gamma-glutamyl-phosphate reductase [Nitrospirota bacterium]